MKLYNIVMIHKMHISKKLIWSGTENRSETCYFTTGLFRMILHIFCASSNQFFWYVHFVYHYYIIEFHYLGSDRLSKKFWRWCTHQTYFLWSFLKFEKNSNPVVKQHVFERFFTFFNISFKLFVLIFACYASS